jgi:hypothetical protein
LCIWTFITDELWRAADDLLLRHRLPAGNMPARLVGMGVSGLDDTGQAQGLLFDREDRKKQGRVDAVADKIKERFGTGALRRGSNLRTKTPGRCSVDSGGPGRQQRHRDWAEPPRPEVVFSGSCGGALYNIRLPIVGLASGLYRAATGS